MSCRTNSRAAVDVKAATTMMMKPCRGKGRMRRQGLVQAVWLCSSSSSNNGEVGSVATQCVFLGGVTQLPLHSA